MWTVRIEPLAAHHRRAILILGDDPDLTRTSSVPHPCTERHVEAWIAENAAVPATTRNFAILADGQVAGMVTLKRLDMGDGSGELSFWVGRTQRGKRLAETAGRLALDHAFDVLRLRKVDAHFLKRGNPASAKTLARLGFRAQTSRPDMPVAGRFETSFPNDVWTFVELKRPASADRAPASMVRSIVP